MSRAISVIIPTYNGEKTIVRAVETALSQQVPVTEVLVIDDGSTDATADLVSRIPGVTLIRQARQGVASARNAGLRVATGEFIAFLDCDDEWCEGKLRRQLALFEQQPNIGVVSSAAIAVHSDGRTNILNPGNVSGRIAPILLYRNIVVTSSVVLRRACLDNVEPWFRPELSGRGAAVEDWELWVRLAARWNFVVSSEPLVRYRVSSESNFNQHNIDELKRLWHAAYSGLRADPVLAPMVAAQWHALQANVSFFAGCSHYEAGRLWAARREMVLSAIRSPRTANWKSVLAVLFVTPRVRDFVRAHLRHPES